MSGENWYEKARDSYYRGKNPRAIEHLERYLRIYPQNSEAHNLKGQAYSNLSKYEKAIASFDRAIRQNPTKAKYYYSRALAHKALFEETAAKKDFQKILDIEDTDFESQYYRSKARIKLTGKDPQDYTNLVRCQPQNSEEYYYRAYFNIQLGKIEAAISDYTRAIKLNPNCINAYHGRAGLLEVELNDLSGAISDYNRMIELNPRHFYAYVVRAMIRDKMGEETAAKLDYDRAIEIDPAKGYLYRGNSKENKYDLRGAISDYTCSIEANPNDPYLYYLRSCLWVRLAEIDKAIADYDRIVKLKTAKPDNTFPDLKEVYRLRATAKQKKGQILSAISDLSESIHHNLDKDTYVYNLRAKLWIKVGEIDRAIFDYSESIDINPQDIEIYYQRAKLWSEQGQINKAIADLDRILAIKTAKPDNIDGNIVYGRDGDNYGYLIYGAKNTSPTLFEVYQLREQLLPQQTHDNIQVAIANLNQFIRNNRDVNAYKYTMRGELWTKLGQTDKAIADFNHSLRINPENTYTYYLRSKLWLYLGQTDKAIADYDRILAIKSANLDDRIEDDLPDLNRQDIYPAIATIYQLKEDFQQNLN